MRAKQSGGWGAAVLLSVVSLGAAADSDTLLVQAVKKADEAAVDALLHRQADVNTPEADGTTPLHWAVNQDNPDLVNRLIRAGANVRATNRYGVAPLSLAATNGNAAIIEQLLKAGADPRTAMPQGETALMTAARTGNADAVRILMAHGADVNAKEAFRGQTALMWAAAQDHPLAAQALVERGADVHARSNGGFTPLLFAARGGYVEVARVLLAAGAGINEALPLVEGSVLDLGALTPRRKGSQSRTALADQPKGETPLLLAINNFNYEFADFLLDQGADPMRGPGYTALHALVWARRPDARNLQTSPPNPVQIDNLDSLDFAKSLLVHGADVNARLSTKRRLPMGSFVSLVGATPLLLAAKTADMALIRFLLANGADPRLTTEQHATLLMIAAGLGFRGEYTAGSNSEALEAAKLAFELTPDALHDTDSLGNTALHGAADRGAPDNVQFLFDRGAKLNAANGRGLTPLHLARGLAYIVDRGVPEVEKLLLKLGAVPTEPPEGYTREDGGYREPVLEKPLSSTVTRSSSPSR